MDSAELNEYISLDAPEDDYYTAKFFRTWGANCVCIKNSEDLGRLCDDPKKKPETTLIKLVAQKMGHTVAVCKSSYLHPEILSQCINPKKLEECLPKGFSTEGYKDEEIKLMQILCTKLS